MKYPEHITETLLFGSICDSQFHVAACVGKNIAHNSAVLDKSILTFSLQLSCFRFETGPRPQ